MLRQSVIAVAAAVSLHPLGWTATLVNAERVNTGADGSVRLCQAIPPTLLTLRIRYHAARPGSRVRLRVSVPDHHPRVRHLRLPARSGRVARTFSPQGLRLRGAAFREGRYVVRGRGLRATLRLVGEGAC
jgi:hypothetical protein